MLGADLSDQSCDRRDLHWAGLEATLAEQRRGSTSGRLTSVVGENREGIEVLRLPRVVKGFQSFGLVRELGVILVTS